MSPERNKDVVQTGTLIVMREGARSWLFLVLSVVYDVDTM